MLRVSGRERVAHLRDLFLDLQDDVGGAEPVEAARGRAAAVFVRAQQPRKRFGYTVEGAARRGARGGTLPLLQIFPPVQHLVRRHGGAFVAEHVWMPPDQLGRDCVDGIGDTRTVPPPRTRARERRLRTAGRQALRAGHARSPRSIASSASYVSSSRKGRSDCSVCSRSHGQPSGALSLRMISTSWSKPFSGVGMLPAGLRDGVRYLCPWLNRPRFHFTGFIISLAHTAAVHFGDLPEPGADQPVRRICPRRSRSSTSSRCSKENARQPDRGRAPGARTAALRAADALRRAARRYHHASSSRDSARTV